MRPAATAWAIRRIAGVAFLVLISGFAFAQPRGSNPEFFSGGWKKSLSTPSDLTESLARRLNPSENVFVFPPDSKLTQRERVIRDTLRAAVMARLPGPGIRQPVDPIEFDAKNRDANRFCLGTPPRACPEVKGTDEEEFWRSKVRPMMTLNQSYEDERPLLAVGKEKCLGMSEGPSSPTALDQSLRADWSRLQQLGKSIGKLVNLKESGSATGVYLSDGQLLASQHVVKWISDNTKVEWPAVGGNPTSAGKVLKLAAVNLNCDLAIFYINAPNSNIPGLREQFDERVSSPPPMRQVTALGYPPRYGEMQLCLSRKIMGDLGNLRASPGVTRELQTQAQGAHDCATDNGSSGSAIVDLSTLRIVGIQSGFQLVSNEWVNIFSPVSRDCIPLIEMQ